MYKDVFMEQLHTHYTISDTKISQCCIGLGNKECGCKSIMPFAHGNI